MCQIVADSLSVAPGFERKIIGMRNPPSSFLWYIISRGGCLTGLDDFSRGRMD